VGFSATSDGSTILADRSSTRCLASRRRSCGLPGIVRGSVAVQSENEVTPPSLSSPTDGLLAGSAPRLAPGRAGAGRVGMDGGALACSTSPVGN